MNQKVDKYINSLNPITLTGAKLQVGNSIYGYTAASIIRKVALEAKINL